VWARFLAVVGVGVWSLFLLFASLGMIVDRGLADVGIAWVGVLGIGVGAPVLLLWQINRAIAAHEASRGAVPDAREKEKELLGALEERGEITPVTAAISTSLTADEAAKMLEGMTGKGYLQLRVEEGLPTYVLTGHDARGLPPASTPPDRPDGGPPKPPSEDLSERELEVLALLASGRTNSEIADDLFVAVGTVKSHVNNIYNKLEVRNRAEAVTRARELRLLS
jgi:DNA-binding CsgD family transcriptional regulator